MKEDFQRIYRVLGKGPWTSDKPPKPLVNLVEKKIIKPCKALDVGCGEGFYSKYLVENGFDVIGIDFSEIGINIARSNAPGVDFRVIDAANEDLTQLGKFDFCLEWSIMHCIPPEQRSQYVANIAKIMNPGALYLSTSFNYQSEKHGTPGKRERTTSGGTKLWFLSLNEAIGLFNQHYKIIEANDKATLGKQEKHQANYLLMQRK
jgi:methyl halide transferase